MYRGRDQRGRQKDIESRMWVRKKKKSNRKGVDWRGKENKRWTFGVIETKEERRERAKDRAGMER